MMITKKSSDGKKKECHHGLLDMVFSWPIKDVLNKNLYTDKVHQIPDIFPSTSNYLNAFKVPLIEETRAEFCSGLDSVGNAPKCEISGIWLSKNYRPGTKNLYYDIITKNISDPDNQSILYEPETGDIFAITDKRPRNIGDLIKPDIPLLHLGYVSRTEEDEPRFEILSSEKMDRDLLKKNDRLFVSYLMNLTTNMRIWTALHRDPKSNSFGLLQNGLQYNSDVDEGCSVCISEEKLDVKETYASLISRFGLDESQREAIVNSVSLRNCSHNYNLKMIWGPPGTGKTKTVACMLFALLKLNSCRALTCAPTNIAVIQVAKRLVTIFLESTRYDTYGLGDIILFGNGKRMKIDDHCELVDVFLKYRVRLIGQCLSPLTGWKRSLESMITLLENSRARYNAVVVQDKGDENDKEAAKDKNGSAFNDAEVEKGRRITTAKKWKEVINKSMKENNKQTKKLGQRNGEGKHVDEDINESDDKETDKGAMTFEEFMMNNFCSLANQLVFCAENLYTHLPTSLLPLNVAKQMSKLIDMLNTLLYKAKKLIASDFTELIMKKKSGIISLLKLLLRQYPEPKISGTIREFCLDNARLVFCTASGSIKVNSNVDMVIIDEAAQLKECESTISLQIPGLRTAILIGDDRQLPAMVQSEVLKKMNFGRSLFQRLSGLGKKKHLLNIQYRMHPSISLFPNREFYENKIVDAPNVKEKSYAKKYLEGGMYGSYSFINVSGGKESFKEGHSPRNFEEATVVDRIIAKLFKKYYCTTKQKVSVGVISPYKGQVGLLQEKLEKKYITHKEKFCINIRSVDGFQGGEEDIIIISTVRCNVGGSVGFLSNCQRTNVALTRARYCLWIVGSGSTLGNSRSVWNDLVLDAKTRGCFYDADDDIDLNHAMLASKFDFFGHLKLDKAKWKVIFSAEFKVSISRTSVKTQIQVKKLLHKIAGGWRQPNVEKPMNVSIGDSIAYELLEQYKVDETLQIAWSVEIVKENSKYIQVIKVWDILPNSKIPYLVKNVGIVFGRYTVDFMNRCKCKHLEGNLVVPMSWPAQSFHMAPLTSDQVESCLSNQLAAMTLGHNRKGSNPTQVRKNGVPLWRQVQQKNNK